MLVDWDNDQRDKYTKVKLAVKIHNLNYSKSKKVNKMEYNVLIINVKMLNQKISGVGKKRKRKKNKWDTRLDYCLSAKLMIGLTASCGNAVKEWYTIPNRHARSLPRLLSTHSWASLGKFSLNMLATASFFCWYQGPNNSNISQSWWN